MTMNIDTALRAAVYRGPSVESVHTAFAAVWDDSSGLTGGAGDTALVTTLRSAAKPLQAIPIVTLPGSRELRLQDEEIAICCASHSGGPRHSALAASVLALSGYLPDDLVCGPAGNPPSPLKHGCSGNHAALLLGAHILGAPLEGYENPDHPIQRLVRDQIEAMAGEKSVLATDGCGVPTFYLSLTGMARAFAALVRPSEPWSVLPEVMGAHADLIGGENWPDVWIMQATRGRVIAKTGAEGLLCLGMRDGRGMAIKVLDGNARALGPVTIQLLLRHGWITEDEAGDALLTALSKPILWDSRGVAVGEIRMLAESQ